MTWEKCILKWVKRLLKDPYWKVTVAASAELEYPYSCQAYTDNYMYRRAKIEYREDAPVDNAIACHEVVHLMLAPMGEILRQGSLKAGAGGKVLSEWGRQAEEIVCDAIAYAILDAYGEK